MCPLRILCELCGLYFYRKAHKENRNAARKRIQFSINTTSTLTTLKMNEEKTMLPDKTIENKIYIIRNTKVMLDRDLAELYGVETKYPKRQVKRNIIRFPDDFMFELTQDEFKEWRSQFVTSKSDKQGLRYAPFAFTEDGVAQLSTVLNSKRAIMVNFQIIRMFNRLRKTSLTQQDILRKIENIERNNIEQDDKINLIFEYLKQLEEVKQVEENYYN